MWFWRVRGHILGYMGPGGSLLKTSQRNSQQRVQDAGRWTDLKTWPRGRLQQLCAASGKQASFWSSLLIPDSHNLVEWDIQSPSKGRLSLVEGSMYLSTGLCNISKINWARAIQQNRNISIFVTKWHSRSRGTMREQHFMSPDLLIILRYLVYSWWKLVRKQLC